MASSDLSVSSEHHVRPMGGEADFTSQTASRGAFTDAPAAPTPQDIVLLPNAGVPGPLTDDFDFDGKITLPDGINRFQLPLAVRVRENAIIEDYNNASILKTVNVKFTLAPRPTDLDIGPPLRSTYFYSEDEIQDLVDSEALCALLAPLPPSLLREIVASRVHIKKQTEDERQASKEKDREADGSLHSRLLGSMEMLDLIERSLRESKDVFIPTVYLLNIRNRLPPPLHFFTNKNIALVNNSPRIVHTKVMRPFNPDEKSTEKIVLLDMAKMISIWGNDDNYTCMSPLRFLEASKNLLEALKLLSKAPTLMDSVGPPTPASTNHAIEYEKHLNFFKQVEDFESSYSLWYKFEREARLEILMANVVFNWSKYASRVDVILQSHRALVEDRRRFSNAKVPRTSYAADATSLRSYSKPSSSLFREYSPACLLCGKAHRFTEHPANVVSFDDGKPLFTRLAGNQLVIAKSSRGSQHKRVCGVYNLDRTCDNRHGNDALHICSLCGGDHPAFSRSTSCLRVINSRFCT